MRIYTRSGDKGETGLFGGSRVGKSSLRIAAYGEVDELNSVLGWCAVVAVGTELECLRRVQSLLFSIGSWLATPAAASASTRSHLPAWQEDAISQLEGEIDTWEQSLEPLANFILPGGNELASRLHIARCVGRRAERAVVVLSEKEDSQVEAHHLAYLNRLSDWLFVFARYVNHAAGEPDVPWR